MASGAQILSTDYPKAEPAQWTGYSVSFADGAMARCNPVARNRGAMTTRFGWPLLTLPDWPLSRVAAAQAAEGLLLAFPPG